MERQTVSRKEYLHIMNEKLRNHPRWQEIKDKAGIELDFQDIMPHFNNSFVIRWPFAKAHREGANQMYEAVLAEMLQQYTFHTAEGEGDDEETDTSVTG